jgi:hypothetical protein
LKLLSKSIDLRKNLRLSTTKHRVKFFGNERLVGRPLPDSQQRVIVEFIRAVFLGRFADGDCDGIGCPIGRAAVKKIPKLLFEGISELFRIGVVGSLF